MFEEQLLIVRAQRRLIEQELTERRVLLSLAVCLAIGSACCALLGLLPASILGGLASCGFGTLARISRRNGAED
jgi:hypothetical protein